MSLVNSLVIGYGNSLRGDDGIGIKVAQIVADWHLPKVRSLSLHQLTPELAAELAQVDLAIFVDAYQCADPDVVKIHPLKPSSSIQFKSHFSDPEALLSLTQALFGKCPQAWWVIVPGISFELSDRLSPLAKQGIKQASQQIRSLVKGLVTENMVRQPICTKSV
ncbi:MAG: hydrogenase maturation protease [Pleurocapsa sp. SU_5_0]|nr:hydrogenase maturation protease [Pleurocapsa sp. SU_5_0]NJO96364.1 hydrogenase maturation protease [Pleurocapsa sp. CRU_1_2]NJR47452.1 hydrogenase maturation protease [Hyellaceae cyanobacterium CSU_1_1]